MQARDLEKPSPPVQVRHLLTAETAATEKEPQLNKYAANGHPVEPTQAKTTKPTVSVGTQSPQEKSSEGPSDERSPPGSRERWPWLLPYAGSHNWGHYGEELFLPSASGREGSFFGRAPPPKILTPRAFPRGPAFQLLLAPRGRAYGFKGWAHRWPFEPGREVSTGPGHRAEAATHRFLSSSENRVADLHGRKATGKMDRDHLQ